MFGIFQSTTIPALEQSMAFAQRRHELLAGNVANIDTPGYRQKDLDETHFQTALTDLIRRATIGQSRRTGYPRRHVFRPPRGFGTDCIP